MVKTIRQKMYEKLHPFPEVIGWKQIKAVIEASGISNRRQVKKVKELAKLIEKAQKRALKEAKENLYAK